MIFVIPVIFYFFFGLLGFEVPLVMHAGIWVFAFAFSDIWLSQAAKKRQKKINSMSCSKKYAWVQPGQMPCAT